jgi:ABC-2 type transport system ATP-binding protein
MQPVISCQNLVHYYGKKPALLDVSWELLAGRICGLLGRNGAGKTTTINILNSFLRPTSGKCLLLGEDSQSLSPVTKSRIGYLIEGHVQYGFFDCKQIERFYSAFYPEWNSAVYYHLLSKIDIGPQQKVSTLSCGQRSQVALGLILAQQPDLIIFDDFSMGLDPGYRRLFVEVIRDYAADGKRSILLTSHIIQDLEGLIDQVIFYRKGELLLDQNLESLRAGFRGFRFPGGADGVEKGIGLSRPDEHVNIESTARETILTGFVDGARALEIWQSAGGTPQVPEQVNLTLEDIFIALTGKY